MKFWPGNSFFRMDRWFWAGISPKEKPLVMRGCSGLEWAEENGYAVPVIYYMLGIIFNEAEHINGFEIEQNKERSCVYRLDNGVIHQMAIELFDYKGNDITIDAIL